jgi:hypothetical protein
MPLELGSFRREDRPGAVRAGSFYTWFGLHPSFSVRLAIRRIHSAIRHMQIAARHIQRPSRVKVASIPAR